MLKTVVIGAGAAGCFCAIELKRRRPDMEVTVYESGPKPLAKVAVTGGGRCNLTNSFAGISRLAEAYPRGEQVMKRALRTFSHQDTMEWFEREGVALLTQEDECVFPVSQDAMQIVRTLERLMRELGVKVICNRRVARISELDADFVVVTAGGSGKAALETLLPDDVSITNTVPSLFTFKIADESLRSLMGTVAENVGLCLAGTAFRSHGTLLVTDWGVSGPATLKLSSYAARHLADNGYRATLLVNWLDSTESEVRRILASSISGNGKKFISNAHPEGMTDRLWQHLLQRSGIRSDLRWQELGNKGVNKLVNTLTADGYQIVGRARFKEEFVTCGGVDLSGIDLNTLESKTHPGLFFAGEVLDIDAITGGFNLQAAWSTGYTVARTIASEK
ncbi:MAG: aminoacetone oxidase family FAD-binding enzyme [Bacteroidia bacterium]|nr:aminoacetone oxidase family FAD-binding enzyme [Bacteroidia bacterium]